MEEAHCGSRVQELNARGQIRGDGGCASGGEWKRVEHGKEDTFPERLHVSAEMCS